MKKHFLSFITLLLYGTITYSQTLHVRAGVSYATLDWKFLNPTGPSEEQYKDPLVGYAIGLGLEYFDKGLFSLSSDVWLYRSGGQYTSEEKAQKQNFTFRFEDADQIQVDYASFSTCVNINPINGKTKLQFQLGPRVDFILSGTDKEPLKFVKERDGLSRVNYGFNLGLGLYRVTEKWEYGVHALWLNRLKKLADLEGAVTPRALFAGAEASEQVFLLQLSLGYHLK